jgi:hypothetical protein
MIRFLFRFAQHKLVVRFVIDKIGMCFSEEISVDNLNGETRALCKKKFPFKLLISSFDKNLEAFITVVSFCATKKNALIYA